MTNSVLTLKSKLFLPFKKDLYNIQTYVAYPKCNLVYPKRSLFHSQPQLPRGGGGVAAAPLSLLGAHLRARRRHRLLLLPHLLRRLRALRPRRQGSHPSPPRPPILSQRPHRVSPEHCKTILDHRLLESSLIKTKVRNFPCHYFGISCNKQIVTEHFKTIVGKLS